MSGATKEGIATYGLTALPADFSATPPEVSKPHSVPMSALATPKSALATRIAAYAQSKLSPETYQHSLRVYSYGLAIARDRFPSWNVTPGSKLEETWFLTAMLHDIGTADEFIESTQLSYEFFAGYHALDILQNAKLTGAVGGEEVAVANKEQAESVAEAIIRHQDVQEMGNITLVTRLIHLGTLLDNVGMNRELVGDETWEAVVKEYPREGWSGCFRSTVEREKRLKPWAMVSRIEGFERNIAKWGKEMEGK